MAHPTGESDSDAPRLNLDRRLKLEFHGSSVPSDAYFSTGAFSISNSKTTFSILSIWQFLG